MNEDEVFFSKIGLIYLILGIITILFQIILFNIVGRIDINLLFNLDTQTILMAICNYVLPFPILFYLMGKLESVKITERSISFKKLLQYACIAITLMWIGNLLGTVATSLIGSLFSNEVINPIEQLIQSSSIYINFFIISIIAPIFEEIFFRKLLIDRTIKYGATLSILLSATVFGLFHGNLSQFFYAFLLGCFFSYVYINTGKIRYPIIFHMIVNLLGSVISSIYVQSFNNISSGNPLDIIIVAGYIIILISSFFVGISSIVFNYDKIKLNDENRTVRLKNPIKTVLLNPGMICFILFFIITIIRSFGII